jgi:hypothetical protein
MCRWKLVLKLVSPWRRHYRRAGQAHATEGGIGRTHRETFIVVGATLVARRCIPEACGVSGIAPAADDGPKLRIGAKHFEGGVKLASDLCLEVWCGTGRLSPH